MKNMPGDFFEFGIVIKFNQGQFAPTPDAADPRESSPVQPGPAFLIMVRRDLTPLEMKCKQFKMNNLQDNHCPLRSNLFIVGPTVSKGGNALI
jgi:hypothetical protein